VQHDGQKENGTPALTDQAMAKIKDLILTGEFQAGSKLPPEAVLAQKLGLSRNSLREAVRALTLIGVLDTRVGAGTYVTSLDADLLMTGMGFVSELLDGKTLFELAASRLTEADFAELTDILERMDRADKTQAFIDADNDFHRVINGAAGNATLASLIQNLSGGMMRARLWRSVTERGAVEVTKQRHHDIYAALRAGDSERASAADLIHLADNERWLELMLASGELSRHSSRDPRSRKKPPGRSTP